MLAGVAADAKSSEHIYRDPQRNIGLWFGGVDDLWKSGKPVGRGGPWLQTQVEAYEPSDAYLMTGYDRKSLELIADCNTSVAIEVDIDHQTGWHCYRTIAVKENEPMS